MRLLFLILFFVPGLIFSQDIDTSTISIPTQELKQVSFSRDSILKIVSDGGNLEMAVVEGSIFIILNKKSEIQILREDDKNSFKSTIGFSNIQKELYSLGTDVGFDCFIDSLSSDFPCLVVHWRGNYSYSSSNNTGSGEFQCNQKTITTYSSKIGMTIVNLKNMTTIFKGVTRIEERTVEKQYPGNISKDIGYVSIEKASFDHEKGLIFIREMSNPEYSNYMFYDKLVPGVYQLENEEFILRKSYK